jgi:serine/threonine-protein kinase HipA
MMDVFIGNQHVGQLIIRDNSSTFMYTDEWQRIGFPLTPNLPLQIKDHHVVGLHGIFSDASPDRWGRKLIERKLQKHWLHEQEYILAVSDRLRLGALRFSLDGGKTFESKADHIPPLSSLPKFKQLTDAIMRGEEHDYSELISNASLGGARAKIVVEDQERQWIAKVPQIHDTNDVEGWEYVCLKLAHAAGICTSACTLHGDSNNHTLLLSRFDREDGDKIHYMSAMTLLGLRDGDESSYIDLAFEMTDKIGTKCLPELYRRMLFNILVSNTDDHLRNHGFLYRNGAWKLSPAFDITISHRPYGSNHALRLNGEDPDTFATALNICEYFGLKRQDALTILSEVVRATSAWQRFAKKAGVSGYHQVQPSIFIEQATMAIGGHEDCSL